MKDLETAVNDFCMRTYGHGIETDDLTNVCILDRNGIAVCVDVVHSRITYYIDEDPGLVEDELTSEEIAKALENATTEGLYIDALEANRYSAYYKRSWEF